MLSFIISLSLSLSLSSNGDISNPNNAQHHTSFTNQCLSETMESTTHKAAWLRRSGISSDHGKIQSMLRWVENLMQASGYFFFSGQKTRPISVWPTNIFSYSDFSTSSCGPNVLETQIVSYNPLEKTMDLGRWICSFHILSPNLCLIMSCLLS